MNATSDIVQKLWNLCHVLRDEGISYLQYITELTYLLFLKMMQETEREAELPEGYRWGDLVAEEGMEQMTFYRSLLLELGTQKAKPRVQSIFTFPTSNKQLVFLQHIYRGLRPGGRAAVVLPDNVLFEDGQGQKIRADLMDKCNLHTILRLPTGIFYAQGVKTNVLFFQRFGSDGKNSEKGNTARVWFHDMRTNMPSFGKRTPLTFEHFKDFIAAYGSDPNGKSKRVDRGEEGRFRCFTREEIAKRGENLDISWLRDESLQSADNLLEPEVIGAEILEKLQIATKEMEALMVLLEGEEAAEAVSQSVGVLPLK